jgi:hypothetical protein
VPEPEVEGEKVLVGVPRGGWEMLTVRVTDGVPLSVGLMVLDTVGVLLEVEVRVEFPPVGVLEGVTPQDRLRQAVTTPEKDTLEEGRAVEFAVEEGVREEGLVRVGVPDTVFVFEEEAVEVTVFVAMEQREGVEDLVEVLLPPMDRVPEGLPVLVFEAVVVGVEVRVLTRERVDLGDLE